MSYLKEAFYNNNNNNKMSRKCKIAVIDFEKIVDLVNIKYTKALGKDTNKENMYKVLTETPYFEDCENQDLDNYDTYFYMLMWGIDAWSNLEHDVAHGEFAIGESANLDDGFQANVWTLVQLL